MKSFLFAACFWLFVWLAVADTSPVYVSALCGYDGSPCRVFRAFGGY